MLNLKGKALKVLLAMTLAFPLPTALGLSVAQAEGPTDPAPVIPAKVVNQNAGKKVLFDNTHAQTAGAADWVIDGAFSDFGNGLANNGYYVKELRKTTPITLDDLKDYDVFVIPEANVPYKKSEQDAMIQYVQNGGAIFFVGDHYNADRNKNRWDANEVFNGYRRGAWTDPAKGMTAEERASEAMQGVVSSDWLGQNFGIRFRYNALGDLTANDIVPADQTFGITAGVNNVAMHAGSTLAITDPKKAKGIVYMPKTTAKWGNAVDQGVYFGGGVAEGPYAAISKVGGGKAAFIGDSSPVEDATPKYKREENGSAKKTYDGFKEQDDAKLLVNMVDWLAKKESYTSFDQAGIQLDQPSPLLPIEDPAASTEPQAEPWAAPAAGYKWYDRNTFKAGSYGYTGTGGTTPPTDPGTPPATATYSTVKQATLPNAEQFQIRVVADNLAPYATLANLNLGVYLTGGMQVAQVQNADGSWPTAYGYSAPFTVTADALGHATKTLTVKLKPGTTGAANLRLRQGSTALKTEAVTIGNVPAEQLPEDKPPVPAKVSITEARNKAVGTLVTVEGVITTQPGAFGGQAFYLQDGTSGIYVFQSQAGFNVGDKIAITAGLELYNTELELTNPVSIQKIGSADVPAPVAADTVTADNQGQLITLENVTIQGLTAAAPTGSFEFNAVKGDISTRVRVDARTGLTLEQFPHRDGQLVTVSGAASIFKGTFQLKPRGLSDFAADTQAPVTEAALSGTANANGWYAADVVVTLTATDNSGAATTEYSTTDGIWYPYTTPFAISEEGVTTVKFHSKDGNGNVEADKSVTVKLDKTAPSTDATLSQLANPNGWFNKDVTVTLNATDAVSGAGNTEYRLNDGAWTSYQAPVVLSAEGAASFQYRSVDYAGNAEEAKSFNVQIDKTAPTVSVKQNGGDVTNVLADAALTFDLIAADQLSGLQTQSLLLDGNYIDAGAPLNAIDLGLGVHTIKAVVTDNAGNTAEVSYTFTVETDFNAINTLIDRLGQTGDIKNGGIQTSLKAKLDSAHKHFEKGKLDQAQKHLTQFQQTLATYKQNGNVSAKAADVLNRNVEYMLAHVVQ